MPIRVAIADPLPMFCQGVAAILSATGIAVDIPADIGDWLLESGPRIGLLTLATAPDWLLLERVGRRPSSGLVVAVLDDHDPKNAARAIAVGAAAVIPRNATPTQVAAVVHALGEGASLLPLEVLWALTGPSGPTPQPPALEEREVEWLRRLAGGATVAE